MTDPTDPTPEPKPVLPYATPRPADAPERKAFGNVWGNMAVGLVAFIGSCIIGPWLANAANARAGLPYVILPLVTLLLGTLSAISPRYRGVMLGMMLVVIGVPLLILGICFFGR